MGKAEKLVSPVGRAITKFREASLLAAKAAGMGANLGSLLELLGGVRNDELTAVGKGTDEGKQRPRVDILADIAAALRKSHPGKAPDDFKKLATWWNDNSTGKTLRVELADACDRAADFIRREQLKAARDAAAQVPGEGQVPVPPSAGRPSAFIDVPPHHDVRELVDFTPLGVSGQRDERGSSPLIVDLAFRECRVDDDAGEIYMLFVDAAHLHLQLDNASAHQVSSDRQVEAEEGGRLRLKLPYPVEGPRSEYRWLVESPDKGRQLVGRFRRVELCSITNGEGARGQVRITLAAAGVAVFKDGERLPSGTRSLAHKVFQQWAVHAALGPPRGEENPVYALPSKSIHAHDG